MIQPGDVKAIQTEIFTKGSVSAGFMVTQDLMEYNGGIYYKQGNGGGNLGGHAIRIIGWGEARKRVEIQQNC
jgi:C1A family cysteine protease